MNLDNEKTKELLSESPLARQEALAKFILRTHYQAHTIQQIIELRKKAIIFGYTPPNNDDQLTDIEKSINDEAEKLLGTRIT